MSLIFRRFVYISLLSTALLLFGGSLQAHAATSDCEKAGGTCQASSTCPSGKTSASSSCYDETKGGSDALTCCKASGSSTCDVSNCKASTSECNNGTDPSCQTKVCSGTQVYCKTSSDTGSSSGTNSSSSGSTISFSNPLKFDTVDGLVTSILTALQGIIVILSVIFIIIGAVLYILSGGDDKRMEMGKKAITAAMIGLAIGIAAPAILKEIYTIVGGSGTLPDNVQSALTITQIAFNTLSFLLGVVGVLAVIMIVVGGLMYLFAAGDEDRIDKGKKIVTYSIIGIVVALSAMVIVRQIATFFTS